MAGSSIDDPGSGHNPCSAPRKACQQGCPSPPCPHVSVRDHSVILWVLWLGPVFCLATLHLEGSKAAEMCTADGRNYLAHLTSEIFFSPFSSLSPFSTNYSKTGIIDRFLVQVCFWVQQSQSLYRFSQLHGVGIYQYAYKYMQKTIKDGLRLRPEQCAFRTNTNSECFDSWVTCFFLQKSRMCFPGNVWPHVYRT